MVWELTHQPNMPSDKNLESDLKCRTRFQSLLHLTSCASTQDVAKQDCSPDKEAPPDIVVWADHQTHGRGRQERAWDDAVDLDLAVTFRVTARLTQPLALAAALPAAVLQACEPLAGQSLRIKWPNDVYANDQKLSGVLIDRDTRLPDTYQIGVGINVNRRQFPEPLIGQATSLSLLSGKQHNRGALLLSLAEHIDTMVTAISTGDTLFHESLFRERLGLLGECVDVQTQESLHGRLTAINFEHLTLDAKIDVPLAIVRSMQLAKT